MTLTITYMDQLIRDAIRNDSWEFWQIWGRKGHGKTTLLLLLLYNYFQDWDKVFEHLKFVLTGLVDVAEGVLEKGDVFYRIPLLGLDDIGVHGSKYRYKNPVFVEFIEMFDAIREIIGVLITTAPLTNKALKPLRQDLTATIFLPRRGWYQFQRHVWQDNFYGLKPRFKKRHKVEGEFPTIPLDQYRKYKIIRRKLLVELKVKKFRVLQKEEIIPRLNIVDKTLLKHMFKKHTIVRRQFHKGGAQYEFKGAMSKLEAFGLLQTDSENVSITDLGESIHYEVDPEAKELKEKLEELT